MDTRSSAAPTSQVIGEEWKSTSTVPLSVVNATPAKYFEQTLQIEATVVAVCQKKGCWMKVEDAGQIAMVRWEAGCGGQYTFPKDAAGKRVVIQGSYYEKTISEMDAKHLEEEAGPGVTIPRKTHEINASAVRIL
jgi:hypothetical protein